MKVGNIIGLHVLVCVAGATPSAAGKGCWAADAYTYACEDYEQLGFACDGFACATDKCESRCDQCAVYHASAVLHAASGKCCDSVVRDECVGPKDAQCPWYAGSCPEVPPSYIDLLTGGILEEPIVRTNSWLGDRIRYNKEQLELFVTQQIGRVDPAAAASAEEVLVPDGKHILGSAVGKTVNETGAFLDELRIFKQQHQLRMRAMCRRPEAASSGPARSIDGLLGEVQSPLDELDNIRGTLERFNADPPKIIVVGDTSHGKSSLLERLTMRPMFPHDIRTCTKMPIVVELRRGDAKAMPTLTPQQKQPTEWSNQTDSPMLHIPYDFAEQMVRTEMDRLIKKHNENDRAVSTDQRILIRMKHPDAVNLDLLDMPGLQAITANNPNDEAEQLVRQTIAKYNQNAIVLVVVRGDQYRGAENSRSLSVMLDLFKQYPHLKDRTIGVFSFVDRCLEDDVDLITGVIDKTSNEPATVIPWFATAAMPVRKKDLQADNMAALQQQAEAEEAGFTSGKGVRGDAFRSEELQRLWREGKAGCSAVIAQLNELYRTMLTKQWYPEAMRKLQEAHRAEMDAEGALGVPQRLDGRGVCHQSSLQESATEAAVRTLDAAAKNFEASFETKVLAPFRTNVDAIVALNESTWLGLAAQDARLKAIKEQLLAEVSNVTRLTHTFWDDLLRAPLDEEARFNMTRFPAFVDALVTQLTTTKKEDASSKQKLLFKHIAHALDLEEPNSMLVIQFNAQGETQVRLPGMSNLLGFLFGRGSTSISEDIESEIRKAAELRGRARRSGKRSHSLAA